LADAGRSDDMGAMAQRRAWEAHARFRESIVSMVNG
jgi:hypothetical protein